MHKYSDDDDPEFLILQFCIFFALSIPTRYYVKRYKSIAPFNLFLVILVTIGSLIAFAFDFGYERVSDTDPYAILLIFLPFFYVSSMYDMDFYAFLRSLPQTFIISWVGSLINVLMLGCFFCYVLHPDWSLGLSLVTALVFIPIQPSYVIVVLKELAQYNYLSIFLEAETIMSTIPTLVFFKIGIIVSNEDEIDYWYCTEVFAKLVFGGIFVGAISGKTTSTLMCWLYSEPYSALCVSVGIILTTFYLSEFYFVFSGTVALATIMSFISFDRHRFSTEVDQCFRTFWKVSHHMIQLSTLMYGVLLIMRHEFVHFKLSHIYGTVIAYFTANICRVFSFLILGIVLNKMAYEMNVRCLMVLAWSGVKGVVNILMALILVKSVKVEDKDNCFLMDILIYMFLSMIINSSSMRVTLQLIGFTEDSPMRKTNMSNCIKFIMDKRLNAINILKQDRYLMQANWSVVRTETTMNYPRITWNEEEIINNEENQEYLWKVSRNSCAVCQSELPFSLTQKDLEFVIRESQVKILKAKKVSIIKQFEKGNIDKNSLQSLLHMYDQMIDRSNQSICAVNLKGYFKRNIWLEKVMVYLKLLIKNTIPQPPPTQFKRMCYYLMMHISYDYILFNFVIIYCGIILCFIILGRGWWYDLAILLHLIFILDFVIKVCGYSNGKGAFSFRLYMKYKWNIFDCFFLFFGLFDYIVTEKSANENFVLVLKFVCLLRFFKFFNIIQPLYGYILRAIEYRVDSKTCFGYDLATALEQCNDEILNVLHQIIGSRFVIDIFRKHLIAEKQTLIGQLEMVQKERPWIAITVKTKQAIRTTLNSMENTLNELKVTGFLDNIEYGYISKEIVRRQKILRNMRFIPPSSKYEIFHEVPWISEGKASADYLYARVKLVSWETGDVIVREGECPCGIYIVINGMLRLYYMPKPVTTNALKHFGTIPIVDHMSVGTLERKCEINICPGDTMGAISILAEKPYDCSVYAESDGEAFILITDVVRAAMAEDDNPIKGLEARMWKHAVIDLAVTILMDVPTYQSFTPAQIKYKLGSAFMPCLKCYKMFVITESMEEVLLMEGVVADYHSNLTFVAPMLIPRTVQKIILPTGSLTEGFNVLTKLLILPTADSEAFEIMEYEKEIAELVSNPSDSCLSRRAYSIATRKYSMDSRRKSFFKPR